MRKPHRSVILWCMKYILLCCIFLFVSCAHFVTVSDYNNYAFKLTSQGLYKEAEFYLLKAEKLEPDNYKIKNNLAVIYEALGEREKAEKYYKESLALQDLKAVKTNYDSFKTFDK